MKNSNDIIDNRTPDLPACRAVTQPSPPRAPKFHENPCSRSRVVPCGQTDGRTDMTKLTVAFRNFGNAPRKFYLFFKTPIPPLEPQQPIRWVPGVSLLRGGGGQSGRSVSLTTRLHRVPRTRTMKLYIHTLYMPSYGM
jgi:hypothetical protein